MDKRLTEERAEYLAQDFSQGFPAWVGYEVTRVEYGLFETRLTVEPRHTQQDGFVHAGVMATMADHTMGYAAYTTVPQTMRILTIEYKINFLQPAAGEELFCRGRVINHGRRIIPTEAEVFTVTDGEDKLVVKAMATMTAVPRDKLTNRD